MSEDALFIKLLDRLDNVTDYAQSDDKKRALAYAQQTLEILSRVSRVYGYNEIVLDIIAECSKCASRYKQDADVCAEKCAELALVFRK